MTGLIKEFLLVLIALIVLYVYFDVNINAWIETIIRPFTG